MRNNSEEFHKTHPTQLTEQLYVSAARAVTSKALLDLGITSIINATLELPTVAYQKQEAIQIAVEDRIASKLYIYFDLVADKIQQVHLSGGKIMVYCRAGQSRSATLCIAYFMKYRGLSFEEAFQFVKARRPIIHPNIGFIRQLKEFEQKCKMRDSVTSLAIGGTPGISRRAEVPLTYVIPLSATESVVSEDEEEEGKSEVDELEDFVVRPPSFDLAFKTVHDQFKEVTEQQEVFAVNVCDKFSTANLQMERTTLGFHDPKSVADIGVEYTGDSTGVWDPALRRSKRRTAFTRLSKPSEIAVSYMNLSLDCSVFSNRIDCFQMSTNKESCSSDFPELHQAYEIFQEVPDDCISETPVMGTSKSLGPIGAVIPHSIVSKLHMCPLYSFAVPLFDVDSVVPTQNQKSTKEAVKTVPTNSLLKVRINPQEKSRNVTNSASLRSNSKVARAFHFTDIAVNISRKFCDEFLVYSGKSSPTCVWETCSPFKKPGQISVKMEDKPLSVIEAYKSVISTSPFIISTVGVNSFLGIPKEGYHKLDFSITNYDTCNIVSTLTPCLLGSENNEFGKEMLLSKQYPYYTTVRLSSAIELLYAKEEEKLKIQWFQEPEHTESSKPVKLVRKVSNSRKDRPLPKELAFKWGVDNWIKDDILTTYDMVDHSFSNEFACVLPTNRICASYMETEPRVLCKAELIGRFYIPQYNSILLKKDSGAQFYTLGIIHEPAVFEMMNIYTNPSIILLAGKAKVNFHKDFLLVATTIRPCVIEQNESIQIIPDEIHDLNLLKEALSNEKSSAKCDILLDVFKRTIMKLRPTFAKLSFLDPLASAEIHTITPLEFPSNTLPSSFSQEVAICSRTPHTIILFASITKVAAIDNFTEFSTLKNIKILWETCERQMWLIDSYVMEYLPAIWNDIPCSPKLSVTHQEHATSSVSFPNKLYSVSHIDVMGSCVPYFKSELQRRTAFQVVSKLHSVVSQQYLTHLTCTQDLPEYQFVQDLEDWPDTVIHSKEAKECASLTEVDTLWFFALEPIVKANEESPYSNYLLFLPDPETVSLLGQEDIEGNAGVKVVNPTFVVDEVLQEMKYSRALDKRNSQQERQVSFAEDSSLQRVKPKIKTIYYGRDRSKSRQRLKDVHSEINTKQHRSPSRHNEREVINNLSRSVQEANSILAKRREQGRYDGPMSPQCRGRDTERRHTRTEDIYSRTSRLERADASTESSSKLLGIVSLAQNLFSIGGFSRDPGEQTKRHGNSSQSRKY